MHLPLVFLQTLNGLSSELNMVMAGTCMSSVVALSFERLQECCLVGNQFSYLLASFEHRFLCDDRLPNLHVIEIRVHLFLAVAQHLPNDSCGLPRQWRFHVRLERCNLLGQRSSHNLRKLWSCTLWRLLSQQFRLALLSTLLGELVLVGPVQSCEPRLALVSFLSAFIRVCWERNFPLMLGDHRGCRWVRCLLPRQLCLQELSSGIPSYKGGESHAASFGRDSLLALECCASFRFSCWRLIGRRCHVCDDGAGLPGQEGGLLLGQLPFHRYLGMRVFLHYVVYNAVELFKCWSLELFLRRLHFISIWFLQKYHLISRFHCRHICFSIHVVVFWLQCMN